MSNTKSIQQVRNELEELMDEMKKSDFRDIFEQNDRGFHDAAFSCVETAHLLLGIAEDDEKSQS